MKFVKQKFVKKKEERLIRIYEKLTITHGNWESLDVYYCRSYHVLLLVFFNDFMIFFWGGGMKEFRSVH